jgi:hypothetical protein
MSEQPTASISWAQTIAQCFETDATIAAGSTAPTPLVGAAPATAVSAAPKERYEPMGLLGEGGMGRVLSVKDTQFGRVVALKEMTLGEADPGFIRRFLLESIVTANLEHPGVVPVYERGVRDGAPYYVMRKIGGRSLSAAIEEAKTLEQRLGLVPAVIRAAHALGFAHQRGVIHRDVKPDNIVLGEHGETIVLDWGIAKLRGLVEANPDAEALNNVAASGATVAGAVLGTPSYMAPEQAQGRIDDIDARTDVFALGAVLYEVLTGRPPFREATAMLTVSAAGMHKLEPIDSIAPSVPAALRAIVTRALSAKPEDRFANGAALAAQLEDFQAKAWLGDDSAASRWFARAIAALGVLLTLVSAVITWKTLPSLRELGGGSLVFIFAGAAAVALAALEWRTKGRARVTSLAAALTAACALGGIGSAASGMVNVFRLLATDASLADERSWRGTLATGLNESLGNAAGACAMAASIAVLLAIVHRRNALLSLESAAR